MSAAIKVLEQQGHSKAKKCSNDWKTTYVFIAQQNIFNRDGLEGFGGLKKERKVFSLCERIALL